MDTDNESVDPSFDLDSSLISDEDYVVDSFCEEWVLQLGREDKVSLGIFLAFQLQKHLSIGATRAAEIAGLMTGKCSMTIANWRSHFLENGEIPESHSGKYKREGVAWSNEHLNKQASRYIRNNSNIKGVSSVL